MPEGQPKTALFFVNSNHCCGPFGSPEEAQKCLDCGIKQEAAAVLAGRKELKHCIIPHTEFTPCRLQENRLPVTDPPAITVCSYPWFRWDDEGIMQVNQEGTKIFVIEKESDDEKPAQQ